MLEIIREIYQYNTWANERILSCAAQLSEEQLRETSAGNFGSIHGTLVHIMSVQWLWLMRWQGISPMGLHDAQEFRSLSDIKSRWQEIEQDTQTFLSTCTAADLAAEHPYQNFRQEVWRYPLWQQMLHQANHATQHRSEVALLLTELGCSPGAMDFLVYMDARPNLLAAEE